MPKNFLTKEQSGTGLSIVDAIGLSASKTLLVDSLFTPLIGRFTGGSPIIDSVVKIATAGAIASMKNKTASIIATSFVVSAGDQLFGLVRPLIPGIPGSNVQNANVDTQGTLGKGGVSSPIGDDTFGDANVGKQTVRFI